MATNVTIGGAGSGNLFVGEDKTFRLSLPGVNMAGWTVLFDVRKADNSPEPAIFSKTAIITGTFGVDQFAVVVLTDDEMNTVTARNYRHSWKRMNNDNETVLSRGYFTPEKATAP
jgi:hypothetical protein